MEVTWGWALSYIAVILGYTFAVLTFLQVIREARTPAGTMAWLLAILLVPWLGVPLYHVLANRKLKRARRVPCHRAEGCPRLGEPDEAPINSIDSLLRMELKHMSSSSLSSLVRRRPWTLPASSLPQMRWP
jgi:Phospholipase_D-nuclease N-terminal